MEWLENVIQTLVVVVMANLLFYIWDTGKVDSFCNEVHQGMTVNQLQGLATKHKVIMLSPINESVTGDKWYTLVETIFPFSDCKCMVNGVGDSTVVSTISGF